MKYSLSFKCHCYQPRNYCSCPRKDTGDAIFLQGVREVANGIAEVMHICGILYTNAKRAIDVIIYYFLHYNEVHLRIDTVPEKRMYRLDLIQDLACKCLMTSREAQISYTIIKRAFRAFYYGTDEGGVPNPTLYSQLKHSPECLWYHAARRTAQVYACYEGMFPVCQKDIELQIRTVYLKIYEHLKSLPRPTGNQECKCLRCFKRIMRASLQPQTSAAELHPLMDSYEKIYQKEMAEYLQNRPTRTSTIPYINNEIEITDPIGKDNRNCNCPSLPWVQSELIIPELAESTNTGYSQGPFECYWYPISKDEAEAVGAEPKFDLPKEEPCPPDICEDSYSLESCVSICKCTCGICECVTEDEGEEEEESETIKQNNASVSGDMSSHESGIRVPSEKYDLCRVPLTLLSPTELFVFQQKQKPKKPKKLIKKIKPKYFPKIFGKRTPQLDKMDKEQSKGQNHLESEKQVKQKTHLRFEEL